MTPCAQVKTRRTATTAIMASASFELGLEDARKGVPFDWRRDDDYWAYERGRLFGHIAPLNMPLRIDGKLNPKAVALFDAASNRRFIL
jgi:hypothetical protein